MPGFNLEYPTMQGVDRAGSSWILHWRKNLAPPGHYHKHRPAAEYEAFKQEELSIWHRVLERFRTLHTLHPDDELFLWI